MKNIKRIGYIVVLVILIVLSLTIYTNANKGDQQDQKEKTFAEIKFIETKIANVLNSMNNLQARNYSLVTSEMSKETTEKSNSDNNSSNSGGSGSTSGGEEGGKQAESSSKEGDSNSESGDSASSDGQKNKKFELKSNGVLTENKDINWEIVKSEIESLYVSLPTITMDLYELNLNQEDILGFNREYDNLTKVVKEENKEQTLAELAKVYEYLPKFLRGSGQDPLYTTLIETKLNIFKAYSKLDGGNWQEISNDVKSAIDTYSKLLTNTEIEAQKQYSVSKGYIMLNELQSASNLKDHAVFLIKYKNLLEEFNNI